MCSGVPQSKSRLDYCQENDGIITMDNSEHDESASQVVLIKAEWTKLVVHITVLAENVHW